MPVLSYDRIVPYTPTQMLDLAADVESYPQFVPNCSAADVWRDADPEAPARARLHVRFGPIAQAYTSIVETDRTAMTLTATAIDGPFSHLSTVWRFTPVDDRTRVNLDIDFGFSNPLIRAVAEKAFAAKQGEVMDAFMRRARALYG